MKEIPTTDQVIGRFNIIWTNEVLLWLCIFILFIIIELLTPLNLVTLWFFPGTIIAGLLALFGVNILIQLIVFAIFSVLGTVGLFCYMKKKSDVQNVVGERFLGSHRVIKVDEDHNGYIKVQDVTYKVRTIDAKELSVDDVVEVKHIEGNTLFVIETRK